MSDLPDDFSFPPLPATVIGHVQRWHPIETAPTDGVAILLAVADEWVTCGRHCPDEGWYELGNDPSDVWGGPFYPTHWMPLPPPPAGT
ncbi:MULTISPECIES: hypothetical protein [Methylobacterium]|uniref:DUF551 domain-containing protein n=1 Tax=Methylobacterium jeotgali TaxID=381630 RepID=A0ABQ4SZJ9_9HYPH|nr:MULTISPECIES: hypothetical protein [Methylobacterium]PIU06882.1 MAG: hypothetical protein COT56_07040 [Methylobacterium sp. CG09_land_8_20_14_0_10_71_15]PIU16094.1 MAG: hypothetical protein COT28_01360 [Methylobacterium sp. CG08_land_8_20_14_0_20_71_15]GBU19377.1 hypothetical protein AwMethylo_35920 [Methylobacterium sp.]GJE08597.1 hypothetical protein AOPFMNJM_3940 [Methylobacterium jeotgali]